MAMEKKEKETQLLGVTGNSQRFREDKFYFLSFSFCPSLLLLGPLRHGKLCDLPFALYTDRPPQMQNSP
jgi:hypothetical protein